MPRRRRKGDRDCRFRELVCESSGVEENAVSFLVSSCMYTYAKTSKVYALTKRQGEVKAL